MIVWSIIAAFAAVFLAVFAPKLFGVVAICVILYAAILAAMEAADSWKDDNRG